MTTLLLRGASSVDGSPLDVGLRDGRIVSVGGGFRGATRELDLGGLVLAPGFIDIHTHSDVSLLHDPAGESKVLQGVTTEVVGNCGFSAFPVHPSRRDMLADHLSRLGDARASLSWKDFDGYAAALDAARPAINVAALVGHSALRIAAMADPYGPASPDDIARMRRLLDAALAAGAYGMSTGLTHTPSALGDTAEVTALVEICARHDALYATHARAAAGRELAAIDEAVETVRAAGARLQFSHLALNDPAYWGRATDALDRFDTARAEGLDVAFDVYPYDASSSALIQYLPPWVQAGGSGGLRANAADHSWRSRALHAVREGFFGGIPWHWDRVTVTAAGPRGDLNGQTIAAIALARGEAPERVMLDLCVELGDAVQVVLHYRTEADMTAFLAHPLSVVGSDGNALPLAGADLTHPRAFGTFPRVLGRYSGMLGLAEAVRKMTLEPARRLGLTDRGRIAEGAVADLVAFDPDKVMDRATFADPRRAPAGIALVMVAGETVVRDGAVTEARPGKVLRRGR